MDRLTISWPLLLALGRVIMLRKAWFMPVVQARLGDVFHSPKCLSSNNKLFDPSNSSQSGRGTQDFPAEIQMETNGSEVQLVREPK